jgi:hypothetical protein
VVVGVLLLLFLVRAVWVVFFRGAPWNFIADPDDSCREVGFSCGVVSGIAFTVLPLVAASGFFLLWRLRQVLSPYVTRARDAPTEVVETAGNLIDEVVGRDHLCGALLDGLVDYDHRRPQVVLGRAGAGKTAVLVQLTKLLADQNVVPVPIRLRDAREELDFRKLAHHRFVADAQHFLLPEGEGDRVWRRLVADDRIVVLGDGLEEALVEGNHEHERDGIIGLAVDLAARQRLPLVIASRPHAALAGLDATSVPLEPLSDEAVRERIEDAPNEDAQRLERIIETADVVEEPIYLDIARELHQSGSLRHVDSRGPVDRSGLRLRLMDAWIDALIHGRLSPDVPLGATTRAAIVEQVGAIAWVGLRNDTIEIDVEDFDPVPPEFERLFEADMRAVGVQCVSPRLAAAWAARLELVEMRSGTVRFESPVVQAYLAARVFARAWDDPALRRQALAYPTYGLLTALIMFSRSAHADAPVPYRGLIVHELLETATRQTNAKALDLFAAAFEVDSGHVLRPESQHEEMHASIAETLAAGWTKRVTQSSPMVEEAKLNVITRFGEAARVIAQRDDLEPWEPPREPPKAHDAYRHLYAIACSEDLYPVRLAACQELGAGGDAALLALDERLTPPDPGEPLGELGAERVERSRVASARLVPMLAGSASTTSGRDLLRDWIESPRLALHHEVALAQGLKHALNQRRMSTATCGALLARAQDLLQHTTFWFTRLTLLHALCLGALRDQEAPGRAFRTPHPRKANPRARPAVRVDDWLKRDNGRPEHPFVRAAAKLVVKALSTGEPERYVWTDESTVVGRVGSLPRKPRKHPSHDVWIAPSTGWAALDRQAQQLAADVLVLLNLADRGDTVAERAERFARCDRGDLPPCLAYDRKLLDPALTVGTAEHSEPGSRCRADCAFQLCPYPPRGEQSHRLELSEVFCRRQVINLLPGPGRARAEWQRKTPRPELRRFWIEMERRARL